MFLAANGATASTHQPRIQTPVPVSRKPLGDAVYTTQSLNPQPFPAISSPMSVSSHPPGPTNKDEGAKIVTKVDAPRVMSSLEQVMQSGNILFFLRCLYKFFYLYGS